MPNAVSRMGRKSPFLFLTGPSLLLTLFVSHAHAQFDTGTISGTTLDSSGALVPKAQVTVLNEGTKATTTVSTNASGTFSIPALPQGVYSVTATATGFGTSTSRNVTVNVGAAVRVAITLSPTADSESITVTGTTNTVNTENTVAGQNFNSRQVGNLPVNGRDVTAFLEISPGSVGSAPQFQGSVNGLENIFSGLNVTVDGQNATRGDITGFLNTQGQQQAHITRSSIDSIQEINFSNNGYTAETGHSLGPQMNIITKAGTNDVHGTFFDFLRNDALDAHDYFERGRRQPLKMNQFGGNLLAPILRDKLFFFANYEGTRQHVTTISPTTHTLSAYVRSKFVPSMQPVLQQLAALPTGCNVIPTPASCAYPGSPVDAGGAQFVLLPSTFPTILREDTGSVRLDANIADSDRLMLRYNINDSNTNYTYGPNVGQTSPQALRTQLAKLDETHIFNPRLLNQIGLGVTRFYSNTGSNTPKPYYTIAGFFTDLSSLPGANTFNQTNAYMTYELFDNLTKTFRTSEFKAGTQIRVNRQVQALAPLQSYQFASVSDLQNNAPFVLQKNGYNGSLALHNWEDDFYGQYNWHIAPRLVVNLGVRYSYNTAWNEARNHAPNFDVATQTIRPATGAPYTAPRANIAPRVGLSYDPFGKGQTVFHAYAGMFYLPMWLSFNLASNDPAYASYSVNLFQASFAFPSANLPLPAGSQNVYQFPSNPKDPNALNWLIGVEQQLPGRVISTINYSANRINHQQAGVNFAAVNFNAANPFTAARPKAGFSDENYLGDILGSNYQSLQVQLRRNVRALDASLNYTWSHESDDMVNVFNGYQNPLNPRADRSTGDIDVRNNLTASFVYDLGDFRKSSAWEHVIAGGWQLSSIIQARSGLPQNISLISGFFGNPVRPNAVPGQNFYLPNKTYRNPVGAFNRNAFVVPTGYDGTVGVNYGNISRNLLRGPGFFQWDFSAMKSFDLTEKVKLQFRTDLFNILNHPNFSNPDGGLCQSLNYAGAGKTATCNPNALFGITNSTVANQTGNGQVGNGTARQAQLSARVRF